MRWLSASLGGITLIAMISVGYVSAFSDLRYQNPGALEGKTILFATSNGEFDPFVTDGRGASRLTSLLTRNGAQVELLNWAAPIPQNADLVVIASPQFNLGADRVARLWAYLEFGGSLLLMLDPPTDDRSVRDNNGLFALLWSDFGMSTGNSIAINPRQEVLPQAPAEIANVQTFALPPQLIADMLTNSPDHPIMNQVRAENFVIDGLRPLELQSFVPNASVTELLVTDNQPYAESDYQTFAELGNFSFDVEADQDRGPAIAAIASENNATGARIVFVGDSSMIANDFGFSTSPPSSEGFVYQDTVRFVLNAAFWLLDSEQPVFMPPTPAPTAIRTITPSPAPLDPAATPAGQTLPTPQPTPTNSGGDAPSLPTVPNSAATPDIPLPPRSESG